MRVVYGKSTQNYLLTNKSIINTLTKIFKELDHYFYKDDIAVVEVIHDPESGKNELLVSVTFDHSRVEEYLDIMHKFEDNWWLDQIGDEFRGISVDLMPV